MSSGLRSRTFQGPVMGPRAAMYSAAAFFCASVIFSAGIGGRRSCACAIEQNDRRRPRASANLIMTASFRNIRPTKTSGGPKHRADLKVGPYRNVSLPEGVAILELDHDELRVCRNILGQMDVTITAAERSSGDRRRLRCSVRQREV